MKPLFTKKNGISQRVAAVEVKMPASYPASRITHESVSVTADGVKTYKSLMNELYALVDQTKLTPRSYMLNINPSGNKYPYYLERITSTEISFWKQRASSANVLVDTFYLSSSNSLLYEIMTSTSGTTIYDESNSTVASGNVFTIYY